MSDASNYAWKGVQDAGSAVHYYNAHDLHVRQPLIALRTAQPVKVVRAPYDASGSSIAPGTPGPIGYVDVQPLVNQIDGDGRASPHGVIYRIPYHRYQGANGAIISDPVVGDIGEIVTHDRDTSVVRATGAQANPGSRRTHNLADSVYRGQHQAGSPSQYCAFSSGGVTIADKNGNKIEMNSSGIKFTDASGNTITMSSSGITLLDKNNNKIEMGLSAGVEVTDHNGIIVHPTTHEHSDSGGSGQGGPPVSGT